MKPRFFTSVLLFLSAYSPIALILAAQDLKFENDAKWWIAWPVFHHPRAVLVMLGLALCCVGLAWAALNKIRGGLIVRVTQVRRRSADLLNYALPYVASFCGVKFSEPNTWAGFVIFLSVMWLFALRTGSLFANPVLLLLGYDLFDIEYLDHGRQKASAILSRHSIRPGCTATVERLGYQLLIDVSQEHLNGDNREIVAGDPEGCAPQGVGLHLLDRTSPPQEARRKSVLGEAA